LVIEFVTILKTDVTYYEKEYICENFSLNLIRRFKRRLMTVLHLADALIDPVVWKFLFLLPIETQFSTNNLGNGDRGYIKIRTHPKRNNGRESPRVEKSSPISPY
jgi:hypothetical protein